MANQGRPKRSQRDDVTVKMDRGVIAKAKFIADTRKITLAEFLTEAVRPVVEREFPKAVQQAESGK